MGMSPSEKKMVITGVKQLRAEMDELKKLVDNGLYDLKRRVEDLEKAPKGKPGPEKKDPKRDNK